MAEYEITTPVEGYSGEVAGVAIVKGSGRTSDPAALAYFRRHGYGVEEIGFESLDRPAKSASKADWLAYAVQEGMDEAEADKATRDELAAKYAGGGGG